MTDLTRHLYNFVLARRMGGVWNDPEYRRFFDCAQAQEEKLRALLTREQQRILDDLLAEQRLQNNVEMEALFLSTLALSRELALLRE